MSTKKKYKHSDGEKKKNIFISEITIATVMKTTTTTTITTIFTTK